MRFESRLRPTQGIPAAAMMNLVLLLVFHLVALSWQASSEPVPTSQDITTQYDTMLTLELAVGGAMRMDARDVTAGELPALIADRSRPGGTRRVEIRCPAEFPEARLADLLRTLYEAGAGEILVVPGDDAGH